MLLQSLGCHVDVVSDGAEAVAAIQDRRYDLVFMDCEMPEVDGYQAADRIRKLEKTLAVSSERQTGSVARLPIVALTSHSMPVDRARSLDSGMDDFLRKPVTRQHLQAVLERWLGRRPGGGSPIPESTVATDETDCACAGQINDAALEQIHELDRRTGGKGFEKLVGIYLKKAPVIVENLRTAVRGQDTDGIARAAHSLKSASLQLGAERLGAICKELEGLGRNGVTDGTATLLDEIDRLHPAVAEALEARLDKACQVDTVSP